MVRITADLLRKRTEQAGTLIGLKELALHQQGIESIDLINQACRHLTALYLQNNIIDKIQNLYRLKELQYLNLAINNIVRIEGLDRCESLRKLDLTLNFIPLESLPSVSTLSPCYDLRDLYLLGNPCTQWQGYREYVIATLPQLRALDGEEISSEERQHAATRITQLQRDLELCVRFQDNHNCEQPPLKDISLARRPKDNDANSRRQTNDKTCHGAAPSAAGHPLQQSNAHSSTSCRGWCPETRIAEQREAEQSEMSRKAAAMEAVAARFDVDALASWRQPRARAALPDLPEDGNDPLQCNEGGWEFVLEEEKEAGQHVTHRHHDLISNSNTGKRLVLTVKLETHLDVHTVQVDVRPKVVRLLARGRLLQLRLPMEVRCEAATARRSMATGRLQIIMPVDDHAVRSTSKGKKEGEGLARGRGLAQGEGNECNPFGSSWECVKAARVLVLGGSPESERSSRSLAGAEDSDDDVPPPLQA